MGPFKKEDICKTCGSRSQPQIPDFLFFIFVRAFDPPLALMQSLGPPYTFKLFPKKNPDFLFLT